MNREKGGRKEETKEESMRRHGGHTEPTKMLGGVPFPIWSFDDSQEHVDTQPSPHSPP